MIRPIAIGVAAAVIFCAASAQAQNEPGCLSGRYGAAGKYADCEAKAAAQGFDDQAFLKCRQKYAGTWTKLGTKYPATTCSGARFTDNGTTITDNLTRLVWEKKTSTVGSGENPSDRHDVDNSYSLSATATNADGTAFTDFLDDLNSSGFAGQHDWRLPTLFELQSVLPTDAVPCGTLPCVVDPLFSNVQGDAYWSSSTIQGTPLEGWTVNFLDGPVGNYGKTSYTYVRAVRGGF